MTTRPNPFALRHERRFCVVYRTGGTELCEWKRTTPGTRDEAAQAAREISRMGYKALVEDWQRSLAAGLPQGWSASR